jgi:co-chaperonin GroES (HSP10)
MKLEPLGNRIVIKPVVLKEKDKKESEIIIPETADEEQSQYGEVVAIGEGKKVAKLGLKKGDKVLYKEYGPAEIELEGEEYLVSESDDVLAKIK